MPYCSRCGVEVESGVDSCPLCETPIQRLGEVAPAEKRFPDFESDDKPRMSAHMRRKLVWEVISILGAIAIVVVVGSDLHAHATVGWSLYPTAAVVLAWIVSTLLLYSRGRPWLIAAGTLLASAGFLAAIDGASGGLDWFFGLSLPLLVLLVVVAALVVFVISRVRFGGLNVVAFVSLGLALFCAGTDAVVERYLTGKIGLGWSIVVLQALVPFAGIMLFLHYRLRNRFNLKRLFHL